MPREKDPDKEFAILDAALKEILERGLQSLSMDAVARRAGLSTGTLYNYFSSKAFLVSVVYEEARSTVVTLRFVDDGSPVKAGIETALRSFLGHCASNPEQSRFLELVEKTDASIEPLRGADDPSDPAVVARVTGLLERGKKEGLIKPLDSMLLIQFLSSGLRPPAHRLAEKLRRDREGPIEDLVVLAWDAIALGTTKGKQRR